VSEAPNAVPHDVRRPRVVLFQRKPRPDAFSIEQVFEVLRPLLAERLEVDVATSSHPNTGVVNRFRSLLEARGRQGDLNHVVGDVNFLALALDQARTIVTIHDCEFMERATAAKRWVYRWLWLRLPVWWSRAVVVPSEDVLADIHRFVPRIDRSKTRLIPNPVAPEFMPAARPFRQDEPVILQVGTRSNKNLERVTRAIRGIRCQLVVLGMLAPAQRRLLETCGIRYREVAGLPLSEVARCYRECDLVVFASLKEGFGLPVIEGQATGRPVVTSDRAPLTDVAGGAACLVDPLDESSIRMGISRVIEDAEYRDGLVEAGFRNVRRFEPRAVADQYLEVYAEVLGRTPARSR
jgi:glycosyltransferase involved in cell wall biosynthesis